jgi:hypothetical protein
MIDPDLRPIVQPGALEMFIVNPEAERVNQVENGVRGPAEAGDRSGIGGNLRFNQNNMQGR